MAKQTLNNKQFLKILRMACKDGKINDNYLNSCLSNYFPYDLVFKKVEEWELAQSVMEYYTKPINSEQRKSVNYVEQPIGYCQRWEKMNKSNEVARIVRSNIENIDKILQNEHLDYKKGEELRKKRDEYSSYLKTLIPQLNGVEK